MWSKQKRRALWVTLGITLLCSVAACGVRDHEEKVVSRSRQPQYEPARRVEPTQIPAVPISEGAEAFEPESTPSVEPGLPVEVSYEEAEAAFLDRRYEEAVDLFTVYLVNRPENPWGHYMLGLSARRSGQSRVAREAFRRALELDPNHVKSRLNLARAYLDDGEPDEALALAEGALELDPESSDGYRLLGRALHELEDVEGAIDAYQHALVVDDEDAWSANNLGFVYLEEGRFEEALSPLARAVELRDDVAVFFNNLGVALERTRHGTAAIAAFRRALELDPGYEKASVSLARVEAHETLIDEPIDLNVLAQGFVSEVEKWRAGPAEETTGPATPEASAEVPADSTRADSVAIVLRSARRS